jgi:hypothetical protein
VQAHEGIGVVPVASRVVSPVDHHGVASASDSAISESANAIPDAPALTMR